MVNKIIEKILAKMIVKKFGISNGITIKSIEVNAASNQTTKISLSMDIVVKNDDVLNFVDQALK